MQTTIKGTKVFIDKDRALYFEDFNSLVISDLHIGKSAHFRKNGLPIPNNVANNDLQRLSNLIKKHQPKQLIVTGDMFHHSLNSNIEEFANWRTLFSSIEIVLVKGNHDKLDSQIYSDLNLKVCDHSYCLGKFCFVHEASDLYSGDLYPISGHIHPGISIKGKAKQRLKLPCFFFGNQFAVLPAFSEFTGLSIIKPLDTDRVFAITKSKIVEV